MPFLGYIERSLAKARRPRRGALRWRLRESVSAVASRAKELGIQSVPAVVINGKLADCCADRGPDIGVLKAAGLGVALS